MRIVIGALATALLCAGCVSFSGIDAGVHSLLGQNVDQVVDRIGYPTEQREFEGRKLYVWSNSQNYTMYLPQTSQTTGSVYGAGGYANYNSTTTYNAPMPLHYECTVILEVGADHIVQREQWHGNLGGCARYAKLAK